MKDKTFDLSTVLSAMLVELDEATARICVAALDPIRPIQLSTDEAITEISARRPLVVVLPTGMDETIDLAIRDAAGACGADVVTIGAMENPSPADIQRVSRQLLEAVRATERRRLPH